jgi:transcriptional regulator with XRE-family HTH domain
VHITEQLTDKAVLQELGARLAATRLEKNLTQIQLAEAAGVAKSTLQRLEAGQVASQLSGFLRVCRSLGLLERFEILLPESAPGPMARLKQQGHQRRRAGRKKATLGGSKQWTWGESS